jgi:SET domain-containing protein
MVLPSLYIRHTNNKGKGVFTSQFILEGTEIEVAPVIIIPPSEIELINKTNLYNYYFLWGETKQSAAIALGYGSMYNHSYQPNVAYKMDFKKETITFVAWKNIEATHELCINYNGDEDDVTKVWFDVM